MKKLIISLLVILMIIILAIAVIYLFTDVLNADKIIVNEIDLSDIKDGSYEGIYETTLVKATVKVHVLGNNIVKIDLLRHENGFGKKAETVLRDIVESNSLLVDTVAGATYSSKVLMKAVEDAIANAEHTGIDLKDYFLVRLTGTIDNNSFEAEYNGMPTAFRYTNIPSKFEQLHISDGELIYVRFTINDIGQNIVTDIIKK